MKLFFVCVCVCVFSNSFLLHYGECVKCLNHLKNQFVKAREKNFYLSFVYLIVLRQAGKILPTLYEHNLHGTLHLYANFSDLDLFPSHKMKLPSVFFYLNSKFLSD